jgi:regulatory protein YycI of two-component signal transduction system YycFG
MAPAQSQSLRPVTRAKNATQRPGLVDAQQKRRSVAEMAKVRSEERLNKKLTEQRLYAALKKVAKVQDQNHDEDIEANIPILAPSLRRHET